MSRLVSFHGPAINFFLAPNTNISVCFTSRWVRHTTCVKRENDPIKTFVVVQLLCHVDSLWPHGLQQARLLCPPLTWSLLKFISIELVTLFNHLIPVAYWTHSNLGELIFWGHIFLPFQTVHVDLQARILEWVAISSSSGPWFVETLHYDPSILGGPAEHGS